MRLPCVNKGGLQSVIRLDRPALLETEMALPPDAVRALSFWSARPGTILTIVDNRDGAYRARLVNDERVVPFRKLGSKNLAAVPLVLYQALPDKERFELVLQKSVELGVRRIVPFVSLRSTTLEERDARQRKSHRWPDVVLRAAKQCRRPDIPELAPVMNFTDVLDEARRWDRALMLYEGDTSCRLRDALNDLPVSSAALIVGPEGGFEPSEIQRVSGAGIIPVTLGSRILRTETAAIAGVTLAQFFMDELG